MAARHDERLTAHRPARHAPRMTDNREPPLEEPPPDLPNPDDPVTFLDKPERDPYRGHLIFVGIALVLMVLAWWGM